jgi:hypothetical protein
MTILRSNPMVFRRSDAFLRLARGGGGSAGPAGGPWYRWAPPPGACAGGAPCAHKPKAGKPQIICRLHDYILRSYSRWRPYRVECTGSLPTSEVKRRRARLVLGWGTAREDLRVLPALLSSPCCATRLPQCGAKTGFTAVFPAAVDKVVGSMTFCGHLRRAKSNCGRAGLFCTRLPPWCPS